jgi:RimJ/RimL family protein N-acetyltransferase
MAELRFPVPPLAGDVVLLRPWREADVPGMVAAFSDPVMQRFSWRTTPYTETDAHEWLAEQEQARVRGEELNFALAGPHDQDVVLGAVSLQEVRLLTRWAFAELGLARLELTCCPASCGSRVGRRPAPLPSRPGCVSLAAPVSCLRGGCAAAGRRTAVLPDWRCC